MTNEYVRTSKGKNDECYTHRYAVEPLLEFLKPFQDKIIWCPFDTSESEFVKVFTEHGYKVINSHIDYGQDFYKYEPKQYDLIISNPPFTNKTEMFKRLLSFNKPFAMLMSVLYLNDGTPYRLFKDIDLQLLLFSKRMTFKGQSNKINFMSCYFCNDFLPKQILFKDFTSKNQLNLFKKEGSDEDETFENVLTCPVCGYVYHDCWEFPRDFADNIECPMCKSILEYEREYSVTYTTKVKRSEKPYKLEVQNV